jgi:hypothetical protein
MCDCLRLTPPAVILNRLAAPRLDLIFGIPTPVSLFMFMTPNTSELNNALRLISPKPRISKVPIQVNARMIHARGNSLSWQPQVPFRTEPTGNHDRRGAKYYKNPAEQSRTIECLNAAPPPFQAIETTVEINPSSSVTTPS